MKFLVKLLLGSIVVIPMLMWFSEATFFQSLMTALGLVIVAYLIGDQMILRVGNNLVATLADAGLTFVYFLIVTWFTGWSLSFGEILAITIAVGIVEWFYHRYLGVNDREGAPAR